jgi:NAD(P)H dehydrogenase (quinone)
MTTQVLVLYYSRHGGVAALADKIAIGIQQAGAHALVRCVPPLDAEHASRHAVVSQQELSQCDALAFGSPVRFGNMVADAKAFWDSTTSLWLKGELIDKPAGVFTSSGSMHGGNEATLLSMSLPLLHHGMLLVGIPYSEPELHQTQSGGTPYGPTHVSGHHADRKLSVDEQRLAIAFGKRLATLAQQLKQHR